VSQRALRRKIADADAAAAYIHRLNDDIIAIQASAKGDDWAAMRQRLDEYARFLDAKAETLAGCVRDLRAQVRGKQPRTRR
jgi:hypothetical protein